MKNKKLWFILGLILCLALPFGVDALLPNSYTLELEKTEGVAVETVSDVSSEYIFHLAGWDQAGGGDEFSEEAYYEDEYYEDEYYEDEYYEDEYGEEADGSLEEQVYQISFTARDNYSAIVMDTTGGAECDVLLITPQADVDVYLESGSSAVKVAANGVKGDAITVQFSDGQRILNRVQVMVEGVMNPARILLMALCLVTLYLLFVFRGFFAEHMEYAFLLVGAVAMVLYGILIPFNYALWWDGAIHYESAYTLGSVFHQAELGKTFNEWLGELSLSSVNYLVSGLSIMLGQLLGLGDLGGYILDRVFSGLLYLGVAFLAVKNARRFKRTLAVTALMPVCLFLGISYSYDISINAFSFLAFALIINEMITPNEKLSLKNGALIAVSLVIASLPKAVYIPLLALMLLLPRAKFHCKKQHMAYKAGVVVLILLVFAAYLLPMLSDPEIYTDSRGTDGTSTSQLQVILSDIPGYVGLLLSNIWSSLIGSFMVRGHSSLAYLAEPSQSLCLIGLLYVFFVTVTDHEKKPGLEEIKPLYKWAMGVICLGIVMVIYTIFYVAYSQTASDSITGVQFRYFIPLLPFVGAVLQPRGVENHMKKENDCFAVFAFSLILNAIMLFNAVVSVYYM